MPIYTRRGDEGETDLRGGRRVSKASAVVEALGAVDELNAHLGLARAVASDPEIASVLEQIQSALLGVGAEMGEQTGMSAPPHAQHDSPASMAADHLETLIDQWSSSLPRLRNFVLPGGSELGARLHLARAVCRRAERRLVALGSEAVRPETLHFMNRLSDLLFVLARLANHRQGIPEVVWRGES